MAFQIVDVKLSQKKTIVVALGGNAILQPNQRGTVDEQYENVRQSCEQLVELIRLGHRIVITHGNGPQVGNILIQQEMASSITPAMPMDVCVGESQGQIGYMIQHQLRNVLSKHNISRKVVTMITQVVVSKNDPAFHNPSKPIGPFFTEAEARHRMIATGEKWINDSDRGWRRVVPSPDPIRIIERESIRSLINAKHIVIAAGGGGVPVVRLRNGQIRGVEAVIDKDFASERLASDLKADILLILTNVPKVAINFHTPMQKDIDVMKVTDAMRFIEEGHFRSGSMLPKILAASRFVEHGGERAVITSLEHAIAALEGKAGTCVLSDSPNGTVQRSSTRQGFRQTSADGAKATSR